MTTSSLAGSASARSSTVSVTSASITSTTIATRRLEFAAADGLKKLGLEKLPPLVTRGVVLDMTAVIGQNPVPAGTPFNKKEIDDALAKQGIQIKKGDIVLFHTGWQDMAVKDPKAFMAGEPGLGKEGAEYLVSKEVVAIGADQWALEVIPFEKGVGVFEVHQILLPRNGSVHSREHEYGPSRRGQGLGVHVRARTRPHHGLRCRQSSIRSLSGKFCKRGEGSLPFAASIPRWLVRQLGNTCTWSLRCMSPCRGAPFGRAWRSA